MPYVYTSLSLSLNFQCYQFLLTIIRNMPTDSPLDRRWPTVRTLLDSYIRRPTSILAIRHIVGQPIFAVSTVLSLYKGVWIVPEDQ